MTKIHTASQFILSIPFTLVLAMLILLFSSVSLYNKVFYYKMVLHPYDVVRKKSYYRLITADLVHNNLQHLLVNEGCLIVFCGYLERYLREVTKHGSSEFGIIYFSSMLTGSLIVTIVHRKNIKYSTAGASGSILGCLFGYMYLQPYRIVLYLPIIGGIKNEYFPAIYVILVLILKERLSRSANSYELHFWGALGGIFSTILVTHL